VRRGRGPAAVMTVIFRRESRGTRDASPHDMALGRTTRRHLAAAAAVALAACGAAGPSPELVDARKMYAQALDSRAPALAPGSLQDAQRSLAAAERENREDPGSVRERRLAYEAQRSAQIAIVRADLTATELPAAHARAEREAMLEQRAAAAAEERDAARRELAETERELSATRTELAQKGTTIDVQRGELTLREAELQARADLMRAEQARRETLQRERDAALATLAESAKITEEARGLVITLSGAVLFPLDRSTLSPIARERLDRVAEALQYVEDGPAVVIEGHTDSSGTHEFNRHLAQDRANAVRAYLVSRGVKPEKIVAIGKGEGEPVATNDSPEGRADNRRVEIIIPPPATVSARAG
jgi:outer membrane protein OmpA-like peptidoglycan-associated protein